MKPRRFRKFAVRADMEGLTGVVRYEQVTPGNVQYAFGRAMLMAELNALIGGLRDGGAGEIAIYDEHVEGTNIDLCQLPTGVAVVCGKPPYRADWAGGVDHSFSGLILLGLHAMAGTKGATLPHTYEHDIRELALNDCPAGEIAVEAAIAAESGVPLAMIVADSAGVAEARAFQPEVASVIVKHSQPGAGAVCLPPSETLPLIRRAATAVSRGALPKCRLPFDRTVRLDLGFNDGPFLRAFRRRFRAQMNAPDRVRLSGDSVSRVWAEYWQMKLAVWHDLAAGTNVHAGATRNRSPRAVQPRGKRRAVA